MNITLVLKQNYSWFHKKLNREKKLLFYFCQKRFQAKSPAGNKQIHRGKQAHNLLYVPSLPFTQP